MAEVDDIQDPGYPEGAAGRLELIWGDGFLSPGGVAEVTRILGGRDVEGCDVLDIGSGAGTVTGIDVESRLVDRAAERARKLGLGDRISYQLVEPGPLPLPDASFDAVFSKDSIIHIRDKEQLFAEALRVLRPGGWASLTSRPRTGTRGISKKRRRSWSGCVVPSVSSSCEPGARRPRSTRSTSGWCSWRRSAPVR